MVELDSLNLNEVYENALRIVYFVLSITGLIFTSVLLFILGKKLKKTKHNDIILTIIAVSIDCIASGGLLFRAIFTQYPYNILKEHYNWCVYDNFINTLFLTFSGHILGILSLQRMLLIVFNLKISIWLWYILAIVTSFTLWGLTIYQILNNNIVLSIIGVFCVTRSSAIGKPMYLALMVITFAACSLTIVSYISIIIFSCKQCLKQLELNLDKSVVYKECRVIIFKSLLCLIPYMLIYSGRMYTWFYELSTGNPRTFTMEYISIILISTSVVVNCLTILYMHKEVNKDIFKLLAKLKSVCHHY